MVTRRTVLGVTVATALFPFAAAKVRAAASVNGWSEAMHRLRLLQPAPASARRIAMAYANLCPEEAEPGAALCRIASALCLRLEQVAAQDEQALRWRIAARVRADFEEGRTVDIAGWMLSRTEVRLCLIWL
jgi:hypothetical protein